MNPAHNGLVSAGALCAILATGWVAAPPATVPELSLARTAIERAAQAGAAEAAPGALNAARQRLEEAERLAAYDLQAARWRAGEAESDARLAQATAEASREQPAVRGADMTTWQIVSL